MFLFLLLSSFTVSIDSLVCGLSLSIGKTKKFQVVLGITLTVFLMCLFANYTPLLLSGLLTEKTASLGGIILVLIGVYNLLNKDKNESIKHSNLKEILLSGFAVGLDGAFLNLSLSVMGLNAFYVPIFIAVMHGVTIGLGILLTNSSLIRKLESFSIIPPLILIALGLYKLSAFLF
jgi:putative Mn2+ efflux pump MntP